MVQRTLHPIQPRMPAWGVVAGESHHAADFRMEEQQFPFHVIAYVLHGRGRWISGKHAEPCRAGDVITCPIGQSYRFADEPGHAMSLYVLCAKQSIGPLRHVGALPRNDSLSRQVRHAMRQLLFEQTRQRPAHATMIVGLTLQLLAVIHRSGESPQPQATLRDRVAAYARDMEQTFFQPADLDSAAAELAMSRRRFTQLFKAVTGTTWLARLHDIRMNHARRLLRETDRTVLAIAFECGYDDLSSFYRAFHRAEHTSPHRWRRSATARWNRDV